VGKVAIEGEISDEARRPLRAFEGKMLGRPSTGSSHSAAARRKPAHIASLAQPLRYRRSTKISALRENEFFSGKRTSLQALLSKGKVTLAYLI